MKDPELIIAIYLRGDQLQPGHVSDVLAILPSRSQTNGGFMFGSKKAIAKIGVWALMAQTESLSVTDHIDELLEKIATPQISLDQIEGVEEAYLDIFIAKDNAERTTAEFMLDKHYIRKLGHLGLSVQFTVS